MTDRAQDTEAIRAAHRHGYSCEQAEREIGLQMTAKLEAQQALRLICEAICLPLDKLADGWTASLPIILARLETIVDEGERGFRERDRLVARLEAAERVREALQEALNCKGPFNGTVSMYGGEPAICTRCTERARAALAAAAPGETEQTP